MQFSDPRAVADLAERLAQAIIEDLFTNGVGEKAERLKLEGPRGNDLGGWGKIAARKRVATIIEQHLEKPH
jgi:hypothetical protein